MYSLIVARLLSRSSTASISGQSLTVSEMPEKNRPGSERSGQRDKFLLQIAAQIGLEVSATDKIMFGERRLAASGRFGFSVTCYGQHQMSN